MLIKLNPWPIVIKHCLELDDDRHISWSVLQFFGWPALLAATLIFFEAKLDEQTANAVVAAASIFAGLLLNLLVLLYSIMSTNINSSNQAAHSERKSELIKRVANQTFSHISFGVLISVVSVFAALMTFIKWYWLSFTANIIVFYCLGLLALTLLIILKRVHRLLESKLEG